MISAGAMLMVMSMVTLGSSLRQLQGHTHNLSEEGQGVV
jgi:hypothetical protein